MEVTFVSDTKENHGCLYDDLIYVGEVKEFYKTSKQIFPKDWAFTNYVSMECG